jgi:hypothetical protein
MIFHMVRTSRIRPWLELGWIDAGPAHLPGWNLIKWPAPGVAVAPFEAVLAASYSTSRETNPAN